ncbi:MAG: tetratricopeptide repeat protein [Acidobacteria bacterium]|nr:tetratricopeptide repeat protein [Acidobacteriota bacterium]
MSGLRIPACFGICLAFGWAQSDDHLARGVELLRQRSFAKAAQELQSATKDDPKSFRAFLNLGIANAALDRNAAAELAFRRAVALGPSVAAAHYNLGLVLLKQSKTSEGLEELQAAVRLAPENGDMRYNLGTALLEARRPQEALSHLEKALALAPRPETFLQLVRARLAVKQPERALRTLSNVPEAYRSQPEFILEAGGILLKAGFPGAAGEFLQAALRQAASPEIRFLLAQAYADQGEAAKAFEEVEAAWRAQPDRADYLLFEGRLYQKAGNPQAALKVLQQAARLDPGSAEVPYSMGFSHYVLEQYDEAAARLSEAIEKNPKFDRAYFLLAIVKLTSGKAEEARDQLEKALALNRSNAYYRCIYGMALTAQARFDEAVPALQGAIAASPNYALAHYQLGRALSLQQKYAAAVPELEKALKLKPDLHEVYYPLARAYQALGRREDATKMFELVQHTKAREASERESILKELQQPSEPRP